MYTNILHSICSTNSHDNEPTFKNLLFINTVAIFIVIRIKIIIVCIYLWFVVFSAFLYEQKKKQQQQKDRDGARDDGKDGVRWREKEYEDKS